MSPRALKLIAARAAARTPYVLEPALAPLAGQWAAVTGAAPLDDRYDLATTRAGQAVPGVTGVRGRLARIAGVLAAALSGPRTARAPAPTRSRARPAATLRRCWPCGPARRRVPR